ncbi:MAG TPA: helix-turn-helix domain-containing protein [Acidimicrobiales bacterium]|nr:helix-turn-helix domain-containing protein [Acidimicrobiales bacterium]
MSDPAHCLDFVADCHVRTAAELLAHRWDPVVIAALRTGPRRRLDLQRSIGGISDKSLTDALNRLVDRRLVGREAIAAAPPEVRYRLTDLGSSFAEGPLRVLGEWAQEHGEQLLPDLDDEEAPPSPRSGTG